MNEPQPYGTRRRFLTASATVTASAALMVCGP
jgi:hypothetical protein